MPQSTVSLPFERQTLPNGLRVVVHPDRTLPLVTINLWYHVGSKNERPGRTGFAHLFEHMLFQGSHHVETNGHFRHIQQVGGVANGSTWYDRTNYYETLPSSELDLGLWLESDRMGFLLPAITSENLETQRDVVMNERRQRVENQPYGRAYEVLNQLLFPAGHPYGWPVIGTMEDIAAATLDEVRAFFGTYYVPNNAVLTLAGDVDPHEAFDRVAAWFGEIARGADIPPVAPPPPPPSGEQRAELSDDVPLARVYLGFRVPAYGQRAWYVADLLAAALTAGKSSLLYRDLVYDRQLAQDVNAWVQPSEIAASFLIVATCRPGVEPQALEAAIQEHLDRLALAPLSEADFGRAQKRLLTDFFQQLQRLDTRADLFSQFTTYFDDPSGVAREPEIYRSLNLTEPSELVRAHCGTDARSVLHVVPRSAS